MQKSIHSLNQETKHLYEANFQVFELFKKLFIL